MAYLHGVETIEVSQGGRPVTVVKSSVIALVGTAPLGTTNEPILVLSPNDAAQFGQQLPGFTIPQALDAIFKQGSATVIVVNTFDSVDNVETVALESKTITAGKLKLGAAPIGAVEVFLTDGETEFTGVQGVDYDLDAFGNFTALSAIASEGLVLKFTYKKLDLGTVTAGQIIGTNVSGVRTGTKCWELIFNTFGFYPKILIAPVSVELPAVATELIALATKYRAIALIDAPVGTSVTAAIAGRGPASAMNFKTSSERAYLLIPHLSVYDADSNANQNRPYSQFMAGVMARVDQTEGYWVSPSNHDIFGIVGTEYVVTASVNDANTEANTLNSVGITTTFTGYGTGTRTWGNRSASFTTTNTDQKNFIPIRRLADIVHESLEQASLPYIDKPLNQATIDAIRDTGNGFFKTLIGRGACLPGSKVIYNPADNPAEELSAGHVTFELSFAGASPAERITFKSFIDINLLTQLV
jgi:phage tail sheath protein FI